MEMNKACVIFHLSATPAQKLSTPTGNCACGKWSRSKMNVDDVNGDERVHQLSAMSKTLFIYLF